VASEGLAAMRPQAELALEPLVATSPDDVAVSTHIRPGMMGGAPLRDVAIEPDAAAIVVGPRHRGRIGRVLGGDLSTSLLHGASCRWSPRHATTPKTRGVPPDLFRFVDTLEARAALNAGERPRPRTRREPGGVQGLEPIERSRPAYARLERATRVRGRAEQRAKQTDATARPLDRSCPRICSPRSRCARATQGRSWPRRQPTSISSSRSAYAEGSAWVGFPSRPVPID
jgi:hypothetical protein